MKMIRLRVYDGVIREVGGLVAHPALGSDSYNVSTKNGWRLGTGITFPTLGHAEQFAKRCARFKEKWGSMTELRWLTFVRPRLGSRLTAIAIKCGGSVPPQPAHNGENHAE